MIPSWTEGNASKEEILKEKVREILEITYNMVIDSEGEFIKIAKASGIKWNYVFADKTAADIAKELKNRIDEYVEKFDPLDAIYMREEIYETLVKISTDLKEAYMVAIDIKDLDKYGLEEEKMMLEEHKRKLEVAFRKDYHELLKTLENYKEMYK